MVLKVCFVHLLQSPRPFLGVVQSQTTLIIILRHSCLLPWCWHLQHLMLASRQWHQAVIFFTATRSIQTKPNQQKAQFYIKMSWWIKIIFIKSQPSSRCLFNILCDNTGNTHKAWQNAYLKENTCLSCEPTKAMQQLFSWSAIFVWKNK